MDEITNWSKISMTTKEQCLDPTKGASFKAASDKCINEQSKFDTGWSHCGSRLTALQSLCGGIDYIWLNTSMVESDLSVIGW